MPPEPAAGREPFDVLLVEDHESTRGLLRSMLEQDGLRVRSCDGESGALEMIAAAVPDAVLAGAASGPGLLTRLRKQPALTGLPVILLSEDEDEVGRYHLVARGADEVLSLPLAPDVLAAAVRARIRRARQLGPRVAGAAEPARRSGQLRRGEFLAQLGAALHKGAAPWQVLIAVRVDQAKSLLEALGQAAAFELEQAIAMRFAAALSEDDAQTLWMEFGFGVLAQRESREEIDALATDICQRVASEIFIVRGKRQTLTVSVGVALAPAGVDTGDADRWFASAHAAQAIAHRLGGNRFDGVLSREYGNLPPERVLIIREWVKEAVAGDNVLIEFQPVLPLRGELAGLYSLDALLRDYRAPLAGVRRREYLSLARTAGALPMIDRMSLFSAFEAIEQERERGRSTRVLVPMDLATVNDAQLVWLDAELRRRKAGSDGLIIEFDADMALGRPELVRVVQRLEDHGIVIAISDASGNLARIAQLQRFPAGLLRLPLVAIDSVPTEQFLALLGPWRASGRGLIADQVEDIGTVSRLFELQVGYVQGDRLAAGGPRLDYEFSQISR